MMKLFCTARIASTGPVLCLALSFSVSQAQDDLTVPEGFEIEVVAEAPLIGHPMMGCFDHEGRLFLAESAGNIRDRPLRRIWAEGFERFRAPGDALRSDCNDCWLQTRNGHSCRKPAFQQVLTPEVLR